MRKNQNGFTIVELLIAITILSIVVAVVFGFIVVGSRSYAAGNSDINVQQEAQLALNQMSDVLIDTTRSVNYVAYDAAGDPHHALKDAEFAFTPEDKSLIMFNGVVVKDPSGGDDTLEEGNGNKHYHFYWNKTQETLFYAEQNVSSLVVESVDIMSHFPDPAAADPDADPTTTGWYVLAQHVVDFSADLSQLEEKRAVQLALTFMDGRKEYVTSNNVTIRNKVGVNDAELAPLNRNVEVDVVVKPSVILEPGETFVLPTPTVTGMNVTDQSVTWSFVDTPSDDGPGSDTAAATSLTTDGILKLSVKAKGSFKVKATANAENTDGSHSSAELTVNIKRVLSVNLSKTSDSNPNNGKNEISPGCEFTVSANVTGDFLDQTCDACGDDTSIDRHALSTNNKPGIDGGNRVWRVWDPHLEGEEWAIKNDPTLADWHPMDHIDLKKQNEYSATFYVHPDVPDGGTHGYQIQAVSLLSFYRPDSSPTYKGRFYDWVIGRLDLTVLKNEEDAEPYGGKLQYGDQTLDESIREGLPTDYNQYVTAIRVVDNSGKEPDKVLLHYTIGGGNNLRIAPDLFDLDLNGSYTFYMQALFPIAEERYEEGKGGYPDDNETIRKEYFGNLNTAKPYGYVGTRYRHGKVFYAKLDRPKITFKYNGVDYKGKNITYDPVNIYMVGKGSGVIGEIKPTAYENIESNNGMNGMVYSIYEGKGSSQSGWKKWYYFDDSVMDYQGDKRLGGNVVEVSPGGNPFMKLDGDDRLKACGDYHVVPGMLYQNKKYDHYEIIGWQGFDYPNLPRKMRYYEFDESTIHVNVNAEFTMEINDDWFRGQVNFPLPEKIIKNPTLFPNPNDTEWKNTTGSLKVEALQTGSDSGTYKTFAYVSYRYFPKVDTWEVEPFEVRFDTNRKKIYTHSYGTYVCNRSGSKWEKSLTKGSSTTEKEMICNVKPFSHNNRNDYQAFFPLPTDPGFPFAGGVNEITSYELEYFDNNMQSQGTLSGLTVTCELDEAKQQCTIKFMKKEKADQYDVNNHKINVTSYGTYVWKQGETIWTRTDALGNRLSFETDFVPTLKDLKLPDGNTYMMDYPLPGDSDFQFKKSGDIIKCNEEKAYDQINDEYAANVKEPFKNYVYQGNAIEVEYIIESSGTHTIRFYRKEKDKPHDNNNHKCKTTTYGIYEWTSGSGMWNLRSGSAGKEDIGTDFVPTLFITINGTDYKVHFPLPSESDFVQYNNKEVYAYGSIPIYEVADLYAEEPKSVNGWAKVNCTQNGDVYTLTISEIRYDGINNVFGTFTCPQNGTEWTKVN